MNSPLGRIRTVVDFFFTAHPARTGAMMVLLFLAGLAEGVGLLALIPLLQFSQPGSAPNQDGIGQAFAEILAFLGMAPTLPVLLLVIMLAIVTKAILLFFAQQQIGFAVARVTTDLRLDLMRSLLQARWSFFANRTGGQFANAVTNEAPRAGQMYAEICQIVAAGLQMAVYVAVAFLVSWWIALAALVVGLGMTLLARAFFYRSWVSGREQTLSSKSLASRMVEITQGMKALKAMAREELVWPFFEQEAQRWNRARREQISSVATFSSFHEPVLTLVLATGLYVSLDLAGQSLSSTLVLAFVFYRLFVHVSTLQMRYQLVLGGASGFFSLWEEIDEARREKESHGGGEPFTGLRDCIRLEAVTFSYGSREVLSGVDAVIPAGSFAAVHGESGTGKTTLVDLITGLHRPASGQILLDGSPLSQFDLRSWRQAIGYVPQEILLFNDSVFMNVSLGDPSVGRSDVERALQLAGAWAFVQDKPNGLDHHIGERGGLLSGGQRQRIAIARALVGSPSLLVLDEATTALDPETERGICETLRSLRGRVTILSISHQLAMSKAADLVLSMRNGTLTSVDTGNSGEVAVLEATVGEG